MIHWIKVLWPWHWKTIRDTELHLYQCCACGRRRVVRVLGGGYQPIDKKWLDGKS